MSSVTQTESQSAYTLAYARASDTTAFAARVNVNSTPTNAKPAPKPVPYSGPAQKKEEDSVSLSPDADRLQNMLKALKTLSSLADHMFAASREIRDKLKSLDRGTVAAVNVTVEKISISISISRTTIQVAQPVAYRPPTQSPAPAGSDDVIAASGQTVIRSGSGNDNTSNSKKLAQSPREHTGGNGERSDDGSPGDRSHTRYMLITLDRMV